MIGNGTGTLIIDNQDSIGFNLTGNYKRSIRTDGILNLTNSGNRNIQGLIENRNTITNLTQSSTTGILNYSQPTSGTSAPKAQIQVLSLGIGSTLM